MPASRRAQRRPARGWRRGPRRASAGVGSWSWRPRLGMQRYTRPTMLQMASSGVLVLVPAHDEAPRIRAVVAAAIRHAPVLVVDDGSTDDTGAVAAAAGPEGIPDRPNQG